MCKDVELLIASCTDAKGYVQPSKLVAPDATTQEQDRICAEFLVRHEILHEMYKPKPTINQRVWNASVEGELARLMAGLEK